MHSLKIFDVERSSFYGGSFIAYTTTATDTNHLKSLRVDRLERAERKFRNEELYREFRFQVEQHRIKLRTMLFKLKGEGKRIVGVGAPMKSSTLLNYCGLGPDIIDYLTEVNPLKIGTYAPGTHIKVVDEMTMFDEQPEVALVLSWNAADQIMGSLRRKGFKGSFLIPVPEPVIVR